MRLLALSSSSTLAHLMYIGTTHNNIHNMSHQEHTYVVQAQWTCLCSCCFTAATNKWALWLLPYNNGVTGRTLAW